MKKIRIIIAVILLLAGAAVALFPVINKKITEKKQEELINEVKEEILNNANNTNSSKTSDNSDKTNDEEDDDEISTDLELEEEETEEDGVLTEFSNQEVVGIIEIKKIDIMFAIVEGTKKNNIRVAIGHMKNTAMLGKNGNCVLAGHRGGIYGEFFKHIDKLENDDEILLTDLDGKEYKYIVYDSFVIEPTDFSVTEQNENEKVLTLITCEAKGTKRLIVKAKLNEQ